MIWAVHTTMKKHQIWVTYEHKEQTWTTCVGSVKVAESHHRQLSANFKIGPTVQNQNIFYFSPGLRTTLGSSKLLAHKNRTDWILLYCIFILFKLISKNLASIPRTALSAPLLYIRTLALGERGVFILVVQGRAVGVKAEGLNLHYFWNGALLLKCSIW